MSSIFKSVITTQITPTSFFICLAASLLIGAAIALIYMFTNKRYTSSFVVTLAIVPAVVQIIIMMVNGNLGAGVAVAGAFGLVRFRSLPGSAKEIGAIFIALSTGLATGMGYIAFAAIYTVVMLLMLVIYSALGFGEKKGKRANKILTVTIPEDLNHSDVLDEVLDKYTKSHELISVKTTNMGSLFKLKYEITLADAGQEKQMIDDIRVRNGNLEVMCCKDTDDPTAVL